MNIRSTSLLLSTLLTLILGTREAQSQAYPVSISGMMDMPYSLNLEEYSTLRSNDLTFTVFFNDPVEPSRDVFLRLAIINEDGGTVMVTNPNFQPMPIQLQQGMNELDGASLAPYLMGQSLVNAQGGRGSSILPEGRHKVCLEVIDRQRNIPISGQFCISPTGKFYRSRPPQLRLPVNRSMVELNQTDNLLFRWDPKHLNSLNPPRMVEYQFTLIEMLPGIANPNDAFAQGIPVFEAVFPTTSFIYDQSFPLLEAGKWYAWRVQARSIMGYDLFENNGVSEVYAFRMKENNPLEEVGTEFSDEVGIDQDCAPFSVDFGPVAYAGKESASLTEGDIAEIGFF